MPCEKEKSWHKVKKKVIVVFFWGGWGDRVRFLGGETVALFVAFSNVKRTRKQRPASRSSRRPSPSLAADSEHRCQTGHQNSQARTHHTSPPAPALAALCVNGLTIRFSCLLSKVCTAWHLDIWQRLLVQNRPHKALRSTSANKLVVPRTFLKTYGDRAFCYAAPKLWNSLPRHLRFLWFPGFFQGWIENFPF